MDIVNLIVSLLSGIIGGNAAGAAMPDKSLGALGNSVAGLVGGGLGGYLLQAMGLITQVAGATGFDVGSFIGNIAGSGVGGAILMAIVAFVKNYSHKP